MKDFKKIFFGCLFVFLISIPLYSLDDECDILCRSGVQPQDISENKSKPKAEVKKKEYVKPSTRKRLAKNAAKRRATKQRLKDEAEGLNGPYSNTPRKGKKK